MSIYQNVSKFLHRVHELTNHRLLTRFVEQDLYFLPDTLPAPDATREEWLLVSGTIMSLPYPGHVLLKVGIIIHRVQDWVTPLMTFLPPNFSIILWQYEHWSAGKKLLIHFSWIFLCPISKVCFVFSNKDLFILEGAKSTGNSLCHLGT